jgi:hypothetical protein
MNCFLRLPWPEILLISVWPVVILLVWQITISVSPLVPWMHRLTYQLLFFSWVLRVSSKVCLWLAEAKMMTSKAHWPSGCMSGQLTGTRQTSFSKILCSSVALMTLNFLDLMDRKQQLLWTN